MPDAKPLIRGREPRPKQPPRKQPADQKDKDTESVPESDPTHGLTRGDWLDIAGIGLCCIVRVHRHGKNARVDVERASDLKPRSIDLRRRRWKRVQQ